MFAESSPEGFDLLARAERAASGAEGWFDNEGGWGAEALIAHSQTLCLLSIADSLRKIANAGEDK